MSEDTPTVDTYLCQQMIRSIGAIISNSLHGFWLSRQDATDAMNACYETLAELLAENESLEFKVIDSHLFVNSVKVEETSSNTAYLIEHMHDLEIQNFTISREAKAADFVKLLEIIEAQPDEMEQLGGFHDFLARIDISGITSRKIIIKEITEDEVVVDKTELKKGGGPDVANIIAFLKGGAAAGSGEGPADAEQDVVQAAADPEQMASLIMQSAQVQQADNPLEDGETLVDFVVGCLKKTYSTLRSSREGKTKTGRKRITKNLLLLEEEIIKRMREMSEEWAEEDLDDITQAVSEMTDELKIDSIADDYMSQRKMIEKNESKILDFIKSKGIENVEDIAIKDKLMAKGLSLEGWNELIIKSSGEAGEGPGDASGKGDGGDGPGGTSVLAVPFMGSGAGSGPGLGGLMETIGHLDVVLDNMEKQFDSATEAARNEHAEDVMEIFSDVNRQVDVMVMKVERSVERLIEDIEVDSQPVEEAEEHARGAGSTIHKTRRQVLASVGEIIQNISEPLSMINTSLEMIQSRTFGSVNPDQSSIILVAKKNADRIKNVLKKLSELGSAQPIEDG